MMRSEIADWVKRDENECHVWQRYLTPDGYARAKFDGRSQLVHRVVWAEANERPVPSGIDVDHTCFNPACVNPDHLRLLPLLENRRGQRSASKTHCDAGHEFTPENTYIKPTAGDGIRSCRTCNREAVARYRARRAATTGGAA